MKKHVNPCKLQFYYIKVKCKGSTLHGHVSMMQSKFELPRFPCFSLLLCASFNFLSKMYFFFVCFFLRRFPRILTINVLDKNKKNIKLFHLKIILFTAVKTCCILHGRVFVMGFYAAKFLQGIYTELQKKPNSF